MRERASGAGAGRERGGKVLPAPGEVFTVNSALRTSPPSRRDGTICGMVASEPPDLVRLHELAERVGDRTINLRRLAKAGVLRAEPDGRFAFAEAAAVALLGFWRAVCDRAEAERRERPAPGHSEARTGADALAGMLGPPALPPAHGPP
jgi:hypothetical protein